MILENFTRFQESDITVYSTRKRSHMDGVTHIDIISRYGAYATSSYDCCVYIWSIKEHRQLGALLLGNGNLLQEAIETGRSRSMKRKEGKLKRMRRIMN